MKINTLLCVAYTDIPFQIDNKRDRQITDEKLYNFSFVILKHL